MYLYTNSFALRTVLISYTCFYLYQTGLNRYKTFVKIKYRFHIKKFVIQMLVKHS